MRGNARGGVKRGGGDNGGAYEVDEKGDVVMDMSDDY
jgi:hypothetical protein